MGRRVHYAILRACMTEELFAGMLIRGGDGSYKPALAKAEAINELTYSSTVTEVRSLLRLLNFLKNFIFDFTQLLLNTRGLLKIYTVFHWSEKYENEFTEIKRIISGPLGLQLFVPGWLT